MPQQQQQQQELSEGILNLDDIIDSWAQKNYEETERKDLEKALGCKLPWNELRKELDTQELLVRTTVPSYANQTQAEADQQLQESGGATPVRQPQLLRPDSSSSCVFETTYTNACLHELVNSINTTRTTRSTCCFRVARGFVLNREFGLQLALPNEILQFNAGFSAEFSIEKESEKTVESEISWNISTEIRVPGIKGNQPTKVSAKVMIEERQFSAKFTAVTVLSGRVKIRVFTKDDRYLLTIVLSNLPTVFSRRLGFEPVGQGNSGKVAFTSFGSCHARFGVSQFVEVKPVED